MNDARAAVVEALHHVAPEVDPAALPADADLQGDLALDSFDFLALLQAVEDRTGVPVPPHDYPLVLTLDALVAYVDERSRR